MPSDNNLTFDNIGGVNLPYSMEAEQAVLGAIIVDQTAMLDIISTVKAEYFQLIPMNSV